MTSTVSSSEELEQGVRQFSTHTQKDVSGETLT